MEATIGTEPRRRSANGLAWAIAALSLGMIGAAIALHVSGARLPRSSAGRTSFGHQPVNDSIGLGYVLVGALILTRRRENRIGWLFALVGFLGGVSALSQEYARHALLSNPGSLPFGLAAGWVQAWSWMPPFFLGTVVLFFLFPDGRLLSSRWRGWFLYALAAGAVGIVGLAIQPGPLENLGSIRNPLGVGGNVTRDVLGASTIPLLLTLFVALAAILARLRRSTGEEREQVRWLVYAAAMLAVVGIPGSASNNPWGNDLVLFGVILVPVAAGIAILKYRLYDIDVVIGKTLVFGALAAFISLVYIGIVVGVGSAVGSHGKQNVPLSVLATAIVAVAFQPIRQRAQRVANRLVYGKRATPYEVLSEFSNRVAGVYSTEDVLPRMARIVAEGTGAAGVDVWLRTGGQLERVASSGESDPVPSVGVDASADLLAFPGVDRAYPVRHQGELLGALTVTKPPGEALSPSEEKLLGDLAAQAGLVLRNVGLTADLKARLEELRASRQRLVSAQDAERRRLERNIHDGAQQQLVSLMVKARLAIGLFDRDPERIRGMLEEIQTDTSDALDNLRDLARGIYPPLLADQGLVAALQSQTRKVSIPVTIEADGVGRYPQEAEAAVYFCCLEAFQNVAKYAAASAIAVRLTGEDGLLTFAVEDDGKGFDPATTPRGSGLQNMTDRIEAIGGRIDLTSASGRGTTLVGRIPVEPLVASG